MKLTCNITYAHINAGAVDDCENCPGQLAISEATPLRPVKVWGDFVEVGTHIIRTPEPLADWIYRFDELRPVEPLTFELEIPEGP